MQNGGCEGAGMQSTEALGDRLHLLSSLTGMRHETITLIATNPWQYLGYLQRRRGTRITFLEQISYSIFCT